MLSILIRKYIEEIIMQNKNFTGSSLEQALKNDALTQSGIEQVGMVKPSEKEGYVCFTKSGCDNWVDLPIDMIEEAELIGKNTCKDHSHSVMKLILKEPKNLEAQIFSALSSSAPQQVEPRMNVTEANLISPEINTGLQRNEVRSPPTIAAANFGRDFGRNAPAQPWLNDSGMFDGGGGGSFGAFGCWESTCTRCLRYKTVSNGTATWQVCEQWTEYPCTRCIWPF